MEEQKPKTQLNSYGQRPTVNQLNSLGNASTVAKRNSLTDSNSSTVPTVPFELLPEAIRDWLNSATSSNILIAIEQEYQIPDDKVRVMPVILEALVTGELEAKDTVEALQIGLGVKPEEALKVATTLKEKILNPIAGGLLMTTGIDVGKLPGAMPSNDLPALMEELQPIMDLEKIKADEAAIVQAQPPFAAAGAAAPEEELVPISQLRPAALSIKSSSSEFKAPSPFDIAQGKRAPQIKDIRHPIASSAPTPPLAPKPSPKISTAPKPFMLHEEKPLPTVEQSRSATVNQSGTAQPFNSSTVKPSFSYEAPVSPSAYQPQQKPASARFSSTFDSFTKKSEPAPPTAHTPVPEAPKVVHYSALKTPLDDQGRAIANNANEAGNNANENRK